MTRCKWFVVVVGSLVLTSPAYGQLKKSAIRTPPPPDTMTPIPWVEGTFKVQTCRDNRTRKPVLLSGWLVVKGGEVSGDFIEGPKAKYKLKDGWPRGYTFETGGFRYDYLCNGYLEGRLEISDSKGQRLYVIELRRDKK